MRKIKDKEDKLYKENVINIQVHLRKEDEICIGIGICIERIQEYVGKVMDMGDLGYGDFKIYDKYYVKRGICSIL